MILEGMSSLSFCEREGILRAFKIGYLLLNIIRVLVPTIIVIIGTKDLMNAILQNDTDEMKKAPAIFIKRLIAGLAVFLIPSFINVTFNMVSNYEKEPDGFTSCSVCLSDSKECDTLIETAIATKEALLKAEREEMQSKYELTNEDIANWEKHKAERKQREEERKRNPGNNNQGGDYNTQVVNGETKYFNSKDVTQLSGLTEQELTNILQNNKAYNGKAKMYAKVIVNFHALQIYLRGPLKHILDFMIKNGIL